MKCTTLWSTALVGCLTGSLVVLAGCEVSEQEGTAIRGVDASPASTAREEEGSEWSVPEEPCDPTVIVVRYDEGTSGARCADNDVVNSVVEGLGLQGRHVHDCSTLELLRRSLERVEGGPELVGELSMTYLLETVTGNALSSDQLGQLRSLGFTQPEQSCPVSAMGQSADESSLTKSAATGSYVPGEGWHARQTGLGGPGGAAELIAKVARRGLPSVRVAVLDSGIDRAVPAPARLNPELGWSFEQELFGVPASSLPWLTDDIGHGTAVATLVGESSVGLAELVSVKVLNEKGKGAQTALATGILKAAVDLDAQLLNLSLAFPKRNSRNYAKPWNYLMQPLAAAYLHGARVFSAAGNTCGNPNVSCEEFIPAAIEDYLQSVFVFPIKMTSVSGVAPDMKASSQSATCMSDISAPSEQVCSWYSSRAVWPGYQRGSGTSFAVPQAVGAMALIVSVQQAVTSAELDMARDLLLANTDRGRLDYCRILSALGLELSTCTSWDAVIDPAETACAEVASPDASISISYNSVYANTQKTGYPESEVYTDGSASASKAPIEQGCDAVWCSGIFSAPSTPVCTSCDFCTNVSSSEFRLSLQLAADLSMYTAYQLRLTTKLGTYIYFDLPNLSVHAGETLVVSGTVVGAGPGPESDREAYLMALDGLGKWTGSPMMRVSCPN